LDENSTKNDYNTKEDISPDKVFKKVDLEKTSIIKIDFN